MSQLTPEQQKQIDWVIQNQRLSGFEPSKECIENMKQISLGQITVEDAIKDAIRRNTDKSNNDK